jgi:alcohol dehydrogenase
MRAALYRSFREPILIEDLPDPVPDADGVVIRVRASGVCRSDWHGWMGHDPDIHLPHVPGHELAGVIEAVGDEVRGWRVGDRVTLPFCCGCGACEQCQAGNQHICDHYFQPGFTAWGSFAELVAVRHADTNLVRLPEELDFETAASLGCRFVTSYRAVHDQGRVLSGDWVAVHGCGGVGLSAVMIASARGAKVIAVDINPASLEMAKAMGAVVCIDARSERDVPGAIRDQTSGGVQVSLDALGSAETCQNSVRCLRKRGRHVQVGLLHDGETPLPMDQVIARELEIVGSHGMQAHRYPEMLDSIRDGSLSPQQLITRRIGLEDVGGAIAAMAEDQAGAGITVVNRFG